MEQWKVFKENPRYEISKSGKVRLTKTKKILSQRKNNRGYHMVTLSLNGEKRTYLVHRLVAMVFIPNPLNKEQVNHIDCNKSNNDISNLEWVTQSENMLHAYENDLRERPIGRKLKQETIDKMVAKRKGVKRGNYKAGRSVKAFYPDSMELYKEYPTIVLAAKEFGYKDSKPLRDAIKRGIIKKNFLWKYTDEC